MVQTDKALGLGIMVICINVVLMLVKIGVGVLGNSYALVADGIESASDIFTSLIAWAGFHISLRPADDNHPYGHGRIEALSGMLSGASLVGAALLIAFFSIREIQTPHHAPAWFTLPVLLGVVVFKEFLSRKVLRLGNQLESRSLQGDAWHHRSDAITSGAAATGIAIALFGGPNYVAADDYAALAACLIIGFNGFRIVKHSLDDVLDARVAAEFEDSIRLLAESVPGVHTIEKCRIRKSGVGYFVELHVQVDGDLSVRRGHEIGHDVKEHLMRERPQLLDVTVHLEPSETG